MRASTTPSSLRIYRGYWCAVWRNSQGRQHRKNFGSAKRVKREEAQGLYRKWLGDWQADELPGTPERNGLTTEQLRDRYMIHARDYYRKPDGRPTGEAGNVEEAMRTVVDLFATVPAESISPSMLRKCQESMIQSGLSRGTVNSRVNRIRRVFRWAVNRELISGNVLYALQAVEPLKRGRTKAKETDSIKPVDRRSVDQAMECMTETVRGMVELQWLTGMRSSEVTTMRACDIDMSGKLWLYRPTSHKTEHHGIDRQVWLGANAQEVIKPFITMRTGAYLFSPQNAVAEIRAGQRSNRQSKVQPSQQNRRKDNPKVSPGECYTHNTYHRAVQRACVKAGIEPWTPNQLRHACATRIRKEYGLEAARVIL